MGKNRKIKILGIINSLSVNTTYFTGFEAGWRNMVAILLSEFKPYSFEHENPLSVCEKIKQQYCADIIDTNDDHNRLNGRKCCLALMMDRLKQAKC